MGQMWLGYRWPQGQEFDTRLILKLLIWVRIVLYQLLYVYFT